MARLDKILNKAIKATSEAIIIYFFKGKLPKYYKEIIIIIL